MPGPSTGEGQPSSAGMRVGEGRKWQFIVGGECATLVEWRVSDEAACLLQTRDLALPPAVTLAPKMEPGMAWATHWAGVLPHVEPWLGLQLRQGEADQGQTCGWAGLGKGLEPGS